ncbi:hypothetical protein [Azotobacter beijerinckii]|uniref:hypothetical protein n=1 Tax=Azotobacter beijerinckii TaxID=170623 RepID=UPI002953A18B|nr:hypothetical protein [Azotobacter beijerinckii]MDV7211352.1 hypothetical protein [Azotobacter beijerinckii]
MKRESTINNKTAKELAFIRLKRGYEDGSIISHQLHIISVLGAISFAFFLALFSAGESASSEILLKLSEVLFAISLVSNALLFFHYQASRDHEYIWELDCTNPMSLYKGVALGAPVLGVLLLIAHYYIPAAIFALLTAALAVIVLKLSAKAVIINNANLTARRAALMDSGQLDDYEKLSDLEFKHRPSGNDSTTSRYKYKIIVQQGALPKDISLQHKVAAGDIVQLSEIEKYTVIRIVHSSDSASLICEATVL